MDDLIPQIVSVKNVDTGPFFHLQQLYEFEFSPITKSQIDENGLYDYKSLQASWNNHSYDAYLFMYDKKPVGFCVVNLNSQMNQDPGTKDIAEFFIMPNFRNKNFGEKLAHQIFDQYVGKWEVRQLIEAVQARKFWLKTIKNYTKCNFEENIEEDKNGCFYVQRFSNKKI